MAEVGLVDELRRPIIVELELEDDPIAIGAVAQLLQRLPVRAVWNRDMLTLPLAALLLDDHSDRRGDERRQDACLLRERTGGGRRKDQGEQTAHRSC
jgi:hypothetical protein